MPSTANYDGAIKVICKNHATEAFNRFHQAFFLLLLRFSTNSFCIFSRKQFSALLWCTFTWKFVARQGKSHRFVIILFQSSCSCTKRNFKSFWLSMFCQVVAIRSIKVKHDKTNLTLLLNKKLFTGVCFHFKVNELAINKFHAAEIRVVSITHTWFGFFLKH